MSADTAFEVGRLYVQLKRIADIVTASQQDLFISLPGLIGYFPMSIIGTSGQAINHSQAQVDLSQTGTCQQGYDGKAYRSLGNGVHYFHSASSYYLPGTETFIAPSLRGFTIGGWFRVESTPTTTVGLVSKSGPSPNLGYVMGLFSNRQPFIEVSGNGTTAPLISGGVVPLTTWAFIAARFIPSTSISIHIDGQITTGVTSIPSATFASTQHFEIGRFFNQDTRIPDARCRDVFLCQAALSDQLIEGIRLASMP